MISAIAYVVPSTAAPVFDGRDGMSFEFTLTEDANAIVQNMVPGVLYTFSIAQDGMGGHLFQWPGNAVNPPEVNTAPSTRTTQTFFQRGDGKMYAIQTGAINH